MAQTPLQNGPISPGPTPSPSPEKKLLQHAAADGCSGRFNRDSFRRASALAAAKMRITTPVTRVRYSSGKPLMVIWVPQGLEQETAGGGAQARSPAALERDATHDAGGDRVQLVAGRCVGLGHAEPGQEDDRGHPRGQPAQGTSPREAGPFGFRPTGLPRRFPQRVDVLAEDRLTKDEPRQEGAAQGTGPREPVRGRAQREADRSPERHGCWRSADPIA